MSDQFAQMWKKAKEDFGGKKPGEQILFWTRKSGVGEAAVGLDKALANIDLANLKPLGTALDAFEFAKTTYIKTLNAATKEKGATEVSKGKCKQLADTLKQMKKKFEQLSDDYKKLALNVAIIKLTTQGGVPDYDSVAGAWATGFFSKQRDLKRDLSTINDEKFRAGQTSNIPLLRKGFLEEAKTKSEAIKTRVLPEIKKYCQSFGVKTFKELPCSPELKNKDSHLFALHVYYQEFNESDLPTHIAALKVAALLMNQRHIDEFDRAKQDFSALLKTEAIAAALKNKGRLTGRQVEGVNNSIQRFANSLVGYLEGLDNISTFLGVDTKPIVKLSTYVQGLRDNSLRSWGEDVASGEDVRKKLLNLEKVISTAIQPFEKFKFPS